MARPFGMVWRIADSCRSFRIGGEKPFDQNSLAGRRPTGVRRAVAVGNLAVILGIVAYSACSAMPALGFANASIEPAGGNVSTLVLIVSSVLASIFLLLANGTEENPGVPTTQPTALQGDDNLSNPVAFTGSVDLLSSMSHDLRTPLNAIIGFSDMMQQEMHGPLGSDRYHSYAVHIRDSGLALLGAIESTLAVTERLSIDQQTLAIGDQGAFDRGTAR